MNPSHAPNWSWASDVGLATVNHGLLVALWLEFEQYLNAPWADKKESKQMHRSLGFSELRRGMWCLCLVKESKFKKWQTPRHLSVPSPCPPFPPASSIYLCCSSRPTQNLTQYILPGKWNKEVCLQLGLDGDHLLDVFQGLPPPCLSDAVAVASAFPMSSLTLRQAAFWRFGESPRRRSTLMLKTCTVLKSRNPDLWLNGTAWFFPLQKCLVNNTLVKDEKEKGFRVRHSTFHWACS